MGLIKSILIKLGLADLEADRDPLDIFVLDDDERRHRFFRKRFRGDFIEIVDNVEDAVEMLGTGQFEAIFLDHDLLPHHYKSDDHDDHDRTGLAVAKWLAENKEMHRSATVIVHSRNPDGGLRMVETLREAGRQAEYVPFPLLDGKLRQYFGK